MDPLLTTGLISAGASLLGGAGNAISTAVTNKKSYKYTKKLAEEAYQRNVAMWNAQNAYNTPSAQMQRLRAAGLNPNLIYGNGQEASAGVAGDAPDLQYGDWNPKVPMFGDALSGISQGINVAMNMKQLNSQVELQQAQKDYYNAMTLLKDKDEYWYDTKVASSLSEQNARTNLYKYQQGYFRAQTDYARAGITKLDIDTKLAEKEFEWYDRIAQQSLELSAAEVKEIQERTKNYPVQRAQIIALIKEIGAHIQLMGDEGNLLRSRKGLTDEEKHLTHERVLQTIQDVKESEARVQMLGKSMGLADEQIDLLKAQIFRTYVGAGTDIVNTAVDAGSAVMTGGLSNISKRNPIGFGH